MVSPPAANVIELKRVSQLKIDDAQYNQKKFLA
jgi:hypothetical protein